MQVSFVMLSDKLIFKMKLPTSLLLLEPLRGATSRKNMKFMKN